MNGEIVGENINHSLFSSSFSYIALNILAVFALAFSPAVRANTAAPAVFASASYPAVRANTAAPAVFASASYPAVSANAAAPAVFAKASFPTVCAQTGSLQDVVGPTASTARAAACTKSLQRRWHRRKRLHS